MGKTGNTRIFHNFSHSEPTQYLLLVDFAELVKQKEMTFKTLILKQLEIARQHSSFIHTVSHHFNGSFYQKYVFRVHQTNFWSSKYKPKSGKVIFYCCDSKECFFLCFKLVVHM